MHRQVLTLAGAVIGVFFIVGAGALASAGVIAQRDWSAQNWDFFGWFEPPYGPETGDVCVGSTVPMPPPPVAPPVLPEVGEADGDLVAP